MGCRGPLPKWTAAHIPAPVRTAAAPAMPAIIATGVDELWDSGGGAVGAGVVGVGAGVVGSLAVVVGMGVTYTGTTFTEIPMTGGSSI